MTTEEKKCLYCNETLKGRTDKVFCDSQCRSAYHNKNISSNEAFIKEVNKTLRKNRSILRYICPEGRATIRKKALEDRGFDFRYYTHTWVSTNSKNTYLFCYDYGYLPIDEDKVLIIQRQAYM